MLKKLSFALIVGGCLSLPAMAAYTGPSSGSTATEANTATIAPDNTPVELSGFIIQHLGDDNYLFEDETGQVQIEIDDDLLQGLDIDSTTQVTLVGEVDDDLGGREIEIETITLVPAVNGATNH
ncbi:NirD/YgiW/YdeI family stress tolerance protein [Shewanella sp. NIFS-20-20]|uniref:NirD/YgiW/YdeI family stress tolerance protein n=1 Tax=Shewanella sp. NIFS-20-20 TaxID=2853806 RepID=UPI001C4397BC|nr:NirD/YgiW/YdeI family stress tolerance protein [Shewanella sp. NIFS-20-20]MBV7316088.1 NirD/YgiW/YdeI family stress tolerance protein [Shewanella sp. NIFS-20-20]